LWDTLDTRTLEVEVHHGLHILAKSPEAAACFHEKAMDKVKQGKAKIFQWEDIKDSPHPNLKNPHTCCSTP